MRAKIKSRNAKHLKNFTKYCKAYPEQRFFQALRNYIGCGFLMADDQDTFFWE